MRSDHREEPSRRTRYRTEVTLESTPDGWEASQDGVDATGHGATALGAVIAFCRELATREGTPRTDHGDRPER